MSFHCGQVQAAIPQFIDGQMDESSRAAVLNHAARCAECSAALDFQIRLRGAIESRPLSAPSEGYFESVLDRLHARMDEARPARRAWERWREAALALWPKMQWAVSVAGAGMLMIAAGFGAKMIFQAPGGQAQEARALATPMQASLADSIVPTALPTPPVFGLRVPGSPSYEAERAATRDAARLRKISRTQVRLHVSPR